MLKPDWIILKFWKALLENNVIENRFLGMKNRFRVYLPLLLLFMLACTWFQASPTSTPIPPTLTPTVTPELLPTPEMRIQASTLSINLGEQVSISLQINNVLDATCNGLYYRDGSMLAFGWLGESDTQLLELISQIEPKENLTFTLSGKAPGTAELKAACSGNVLFRYGQGTSTEQWYGVSDPILITVR